MLNGSKIFTLRTSGGLTTVRLQVLSDDPNEGTPSIGELLDRLGQIFRETAESFGDTIEHECFVGGLPAATEN